METSTREYLQKALSKNEFISYIAESNGEAISISGMVLFQRPPYLENLHGVEAYILNMYTIPEYRGKGLAKRMLKKCIDESRNSVLNGFGCTPLKMENIYTKKWALRRRIVRWSCFFNTFSCYRLTGAIV
ncbi:GNAT family N-acetyltransferase [Peribacillus butanolivorans]|uniref:GNAT family N-acetyltransferase n=1 Tax=Peribacillus butanolivorans TaxID=421767 RepID=UPI0036A591BF